MTRLRIKMRIRLQFSLCSWIIVCCVFSIFLAKNLQIRSRDYQEWAVFNYHCVGVVIERGWPFAFQREVRIRTSEKSDSRGIRKLRKTIREPLTHFSISSHAGIIGNLVVACGSAMLALVTINTLARRRKRTRRKRCQGRKRLS